MKKFACAAAFVGLCSSPALAQDSRENVRPPLKMNADHWTMVPRDDGKFGLVHKMSGAICLDTFRDLQLIEVSSFTEDGMDVACQYDKGSGLDLTRLTTYFFKRQGVDGATAYGQAFRQIQQISEMSELTAVHNKEHSQRCVSAVMPRLREAMFPDSTPEDEEVKAFKMGVAVFDYSFTPEGAVQETKQTSLLSVFQSGEWIMKVRLTTPATENEDSYSQACNYSGLASIASAQALR